MNNNNNSFKKQTTMIFTIMICMIALLLAAMVSSNALLKDTYAANLVDLYNQKMQKETYEDGSYSQTYTADDGTRTRQNYSSDGTKLSTETIAPNSNYRTDVNRDSDQSALPNVSTSYYNDNGSANSKNYTSYTQTIDYSSITRTDLNTHNNSIVENNYVKVNDGGTTKDVLASTVTKTPTSDGNYTMRVEVKDESSGLKDVRNIIFYSDESECESNGSECNKVGSVYVNDEDMNSLLFSRESYCMEINNDTCHGVDTDRDGEIDMWQADNCNCDDGCKTAPDEGKPGTGCESVGSTCQTLNGGQGTIVDVNGNCECQGGGSPTPGSGDTPHNYCVYNCDPSDPDTPIYVEPGTVIYPTQSCWMCVATDGSGNKYVKANSFADAANATAGYACKVVESTKCNNAPVVASEATYCWSCIKNYTKIYARANLESVARSITGGESCTIVGIEENDPLCLPPTETTTTHCWSCNVNGKNNYATATTASSAASKTGGSNCTVVNSELCNTTPTPTPPPNVTENPKTGTFAIIIAWTVGLIAIIYAVWYFRKSSKIKND